MKAWIIAVSLLVATVAHAGDPTRVWRTVETDHFVIYYWAPLDDVARRVGVVAERAHRTLSPALDHAPDSKTLIFLADDTDSANGFATALPRNAIQLYATGPSGFSELDDHDDWLYGLVAHEYTHILHLDTMSGLPNIYNGIFGKTWAPNQIMPRWVIEGIAVYEESKRSAGGRNRGTFFDSYIRIARHTHKDLRLDEVSGNPRQYPRGNAAYVYGSHFMRYIFDRFGDDKLREMSHVSGAFAPPFAVNRQIAKVVGKPFTELYDDWRDYLRDHYGMEEMAAERRALRNGRPLTHSAESNLLPHYSADGRELYWLQYDGYTLPWVRAMPVGGDVSQARDVVQIDAMGPFDLLPDNSLVYEQGRVFRTVYSYEDLFRWDARTGQTIRLTTGRRARDPAVSPDGRRVAFSMNQHSNSVLAVMPLGPEQKESIVWHGDRFDECYQPAWSPDGTRIAFSAWLKGGYRDILVVELASGKVDAITHDRAVDMEPAWSADGKTVYFDSNRTGITNIYAYDLADRSTWQVTNVLGGAFASHPSPDGKRIAFESAVPAGGYDLYELPNDRASWLPAREYLDDKPPPTVILDAEAKVSEPRPYRALETLAPQTWVGTLDTAADTLSITTGGTDAVGLHTYSLAVGLDLDRGDTNVGASYNYSGWRPSDRRVGRAHARRAWRLQDRRRESRVPRRGLGRHDLGRDPARAATELELVDVVRLRCRLVPARAGSAGPERSEPARAGHAADQLRAGRRRHATRILARSQHDVRTRAADRLRCERVVARRSSGVRRDVSQRHRQLRDGCVPAPVGRLAGARAALGRCDPDRRSRGRQRLRSRGDSRAGCRDVDRELGAHGVVGISARLRGAQRGRQSVSLAQCRVPARAVADRARTRHAADLHPAPPPRPAHRRRDRVQRFVRCIEELALVGRCSAARRRVLRLLRSRHLRDRLGPRPDRGRYRRDLVPADGEPVTRESFPEGRGKPALLHLGGEIAVQVTRQLTEPLRALRDQLGLVVDHLERHVATSRGPTPYPWRSLQSLRQDLGAAYLEATDLSRRLDELERALASDPPHWFDLTAAVDLGLRLAGHHLGGGPEVERGAPRPMREIELLFDLGASPPTRGAAGPLALLVAQLVEVCAASARAVPSSSLSVRVIAEDAWGVVTIADNGAGSERVRELGELARSVVTSWGGTADAVSASGQGCTFEIRLLTHPA